MSETVTNLELRPGDLCFEAIGSEVRIWAVGPDGKRVQLLGRSTTFRGRRILEVDMGGRWKSAEAPGLTVARLWKESHRSELHRLLHATLGQFVALRGLRLRFYYSGCGPSGKSCSASGFTIELPDEVPIL